MDINHIRQRVIRHYNDEFRGGRIGRAVEMAEVACGIVVVKDTSGERDMLFDTDLWLSISSDGASHVLAVRHLGVMVGYRGISLEGVVKLAKGKYLLSKKEEVQWYSEPIYFDPLTGEDL